MAVKIQQDSILKPFSKYPACGKKYMLVAILVIAVVIVVPVVIIITMEGGEPVILYKPEISVKSIPNCRRVTAFPLLAKHDNVLKLLTKA